MAAIRVKDLVSATGISKGHASGILSGAAKPGRRLAVKIYRAVGVKFGPIADASEEDIAALERLETKGSQ